MMNEGTLSKENDFKKNSEFLTLSNDQRPKRSVYFYYI